MPRTEEHHAWADGKAFRAGVVAECEERFLDLFGEACTDVWLEGWRAAIAYLVKQDLRARELRHGSSVRLAAEFLAEQGAPLGTPATGVLSPHTFELLNEVTEAIAEGRAGLLGVGELEPEIPKLTSSGLEVTILLFENHSDRDGRSRWLTDRELAVVSLLLSPNRISVDRSELQRQDGEEPRATRAITVAPITAVVAEAKSIKRARAESGELQTRDDKDFMIGRARPLPRPVLKPVPRWVDEVVSKAAVGDGRGVDGARRTRCASRGGSTRDVPRSLELGRP